MANFRQSIGSRASLQRHGLPSWSIIVNEPASLASRLSSRSIVLVGLMGAGKTSVGRRLASSLGIPFVDADQEIEEAAGCTIEDFFELYGEPAFREGEERVIRRLLEGGPQVLATGGGAYLNESIRDLVSETGISIWLRADLTILAKRTGRRGGRPLLKGKDPKAALKTLMDVRYPIYAKADIVVDTGPEGIDVTTNNILNALDEFLPATAQTA